MHLRLMFALTTIGLVAGCSSTSNQNAPLAEVPEVSEWMAPLRQFVAKRTSDPYRHSVSWFKIKNRAYSQADDGRGELLNDDRRAMHGARLQAALKNPCVP